MDKEGVETDDYYHREERRRFSSIKPMTDEEKLSSEDKKRVKAQLSAIKLLEKRLEPHTEIKLKLLILGSYGVGKTSLLYKFLDDSCDIRKIQVTIGFDFHHCMINLAGKTVHLRMWDTAGGERFQSSGLTTNFYRGAQGCLFLFSVEDHQSFLRLPFWLNKAKENLGELFEAYIVGNKVDSAERKVSYKEAFQFATQRGLPYIETSALECQNVHKAFTDLVLAILRRQDICNCIATNRRDSKALRLVNDMNAKSTSAKSTFLTFC